MSASETVSLAGLSPRSGLATLLLAQLRGLLPRSFTGTPLLAGSAECADEVIIARHGAVEIRQTVTGWWLETCVKGEPGRARETAMRRFAHYAAGRNSCHSPLRTFGQMVQTVERPGRWRVRIAVAETDPQLAVASARNGKVRLRFAEARTLAMIRVPGRPTLLAMKHAETAIRHALALTRWKAAGSAMLRLHTLPKLLQFFGRFEMAVLVVLRDPAAITPDRMGAALPERQAMQEVPTAGVPRVH